MMTRARKGPVYIVSVNGFIPLTFKRYKEALRWAWRLARKHGTDYGYVRVLRRR